MNSAPASPLVAAADLLAVLTNREPGGRHPVLLDVRWKLGGPPGPEEYAKGHLPGAVFVDLDADLAAPARSGSGRHPLPDLDDLQAAMRRWGIDPGDWVIAYDDAGGTSAARAWWLLRWAGLEQVAVLDGGLAAWVSVGGALSTETPDPAPGDVVVRPSALAVLDADEVLDVAARGVLLDARSAERYRGEVEPVDPVAGHIPGARSAPTTENLSRAGTFADASALDVRFSALGVRPDVPVGVYCGSGVTAAHEVLALAVIGIDAALYPGSWSAWISDPTRPVAVGPNPDPPLDDEG